MKVGSTSARPSTPTRSRRRSSTSDPARGPDARRLDPRGRRRHRLRAADEHRPLQQKAPVRRSSRSSRWATSTRSPAEDRLPRLRNLDVIVKAVELIGNGLDIAKIPMDDKRTYEMLARGESQASSSSRARHARSPAAGEADAVRGPDRARRALPAGPMATSRVREPQGGREQVTYHDPRLKPILGDTYGICIYQEQYMPSARSRRFSITEADDCARQSARRSQAHGRSGPTAARRAIGEPGCGDCGAGARFG